MYSYFHDTLNDAIEDVYSKALTWLQSEVNLIIDIKANKQLKETQYKLDMCTTMSAIIEEKYTKAAVEVARISDHRKLAIADMIATAKKLPQILSLAENTTPSKSTSTSYPHMIYMGRDPPRNEEEQLAECLCKICTLLKLA
jgi:hypothetical protein